jgi:hypothetical protein
MKILFRWKTMKILNVKSFRQLTIFIIICSVVTKNVWLKTKNSQNYIGIGIINNNFKRWSYIFQLENYVKRIFFL